MKKITTPLVTLLSFILLSSCGQGEKETSSKVEDNPNAPVIIPADDDATYGNNDPQTEDATPKYKDEETAKLYGIWVGECHRVPDEVGGGSERIFYGFKTNLWIKQYNYFTSVDCDNASVIFNTSIRGQFVISGYSGAIQGALEWDASLDEALITLFSEEWVDVFNENLKYGYQDWRIGEEKSILGRTDYNADGTPTAPIEQTLLYSTLYFSGDDQFWISEYSQSKDRRPTDLGESFQYAGDFQ